ncbi:ATP-dependent helicase HrpA [Cutibacterium modestum 30N]|uniref:ATP-dependent RNA helicase HrpA n=1 Tax=Cutibacterium modestum TaxID=2559073 RepID=UPI0020A49EEC|nr:ATP-dependent RNA helicase HrpA [Cutibacterium modestum]MCP2381100.1 ATP-dependent helicase HrpA [Cutibacterium modestum 30N]
MPDSRLEGELPGGGAVTFDTELPIAAHADEIADLVKGHQVVVVAGETGSGKTTQLPKIFLALGRRHIAHTQPRRIAARSVAERVAEEMGVELGEQVGYQVRFTRRATSNTALTVMTDGVLLAGISHDRDLRAYDTIIIDEAHERSLNIDFLLGYLKQLLPRRPDLKVIITSATIDTARFSTHFDDAPVIEVSGRTYPVEVRYRPLDPSEQVRPDDEDGVDDEDEFPDRPSIPTSTSPDDEVVDQVTGICRAVQELCCEGSGDILVFLAGEQEIRETAESLADLNLLNTEVLPLFARLSATEQHRVFTPHTGRRIVLATNVAETSLTVPGIRYVIDPGTARISRYSVRIKVQRLPIEPVSQASANQRAGRCGRVAPGICIRLYSQASFKSRPEFTEPEILRTNLAAVILQMAQARLGAITDFPFVEAPDRSQINDGIRLLDELGALKPGHCDSPRLTKIGHQLARVPLDPRLGRMLLEGAKQGSLAEVLVIVAALSIRDVRERPADKREEADGFHRRFATEVSLLQTLQAADSTDNNRVGNWSQVRQQHIRQKTVNTPKSGSLTRHTPHTNSRLGKTSPRTQAAGIDEGGDIMAIHRLWRYLRHQRRQMGSSAFRRMCRAEYINYLRVREWDDLHGQLRQIAKELHLEVNRTPAPTDRVLVALLSGLLSHIGLAQVRESSKRRGQHSRPQEYLGARGTKFAINPGSLLARKSPELVVAVELVQTSRLWARTVAAVQPEWVEEIAGPLIKRSWTAPHWAASTASVVATERGTLFGVPLWADRRVNYGQIDPVGSRQIFIRSALVERDWRSPHEFLRHNDWVRDEAADLEERSRQRGLVADDDAIFTFYDRRIPDEIVSGSHFDAWWRRVQDHHQLDLSIDDLVDSDSVDADAFPDHWKVGNLDLPVHYVFEPGSGHDGVTVTIPLALLNQVPTAPFSWQVPGLRTELATELIRTLPKRIRTQLVPAPDHARAALTWLEDHDANCQAPFTEELGRALKVLTGVIVNPDDWNIVALPAHLRVGFDIVDAEGKPVGKKSRKNAKNKPKGFQSAPIARSEDLEALQTDLASKVSQSLTKAAGRSQIHGAREWTFDPIPERIGLSREGADAVGYPCLVDEGVSVGTTVLDSPRAQRTSHAAGVVRLLVLNLPDPTKWVVTHMDNATKLAVATSPYPSVSALLADARHKAVASVAHEKAGDLSGIRNKQSFDDLVMAVRQDQADRMARVVRTAGRVLSRLVEARQALTTVSDPTIRDDITAQIDDLVFENFISATPDPWYDDMPRWIQGVSVRIESLMTNLSRDPRQMAELEPLLADYDALCEKQPAGKLPAEVEEIGFMLEELRIQYFAQKLGTRVSVSPKRIRAVMARVG